MLKRVRPKFRAHARHFRPPISPLAHHPLSLSMFFRTSLFALLSATAAFGQIQRPGRINEVYAQFCASCHGVALEGGQAPSLLDDTWTFGGDDASLTRVIKEGALDKGMPPWGALLNDGDIRSLVIYIREQRAKAALNPQTRTPPVEAQRVESALHAFQITTWIDGLDDPWSLAFLPDGRALATEKKGRLLLLDASRGERREIQGTPRVDNRSQAGLFDIVLHPKYADNGWLYLSFADLQENAEGQKVSLTKIVRGRLREDKWVDEEVVYVGSLAEYPRSGGVHFGGRLLFDTQGYLYFSIGERGRDRNAQDLTVPMGKIHRIQDSGTAPSDNPFFGRAGAEPTIWSFGHRNPQGLALDPSDGKIYALEHGPRGGDELNQIHSGSNYGWPEVTYGMNYDGTPITALTRRPDVEEPVTYWVPSIAPGGMSFYTGTLFPQWRGHLFIASLAAQQLHRLELQNGQKVKEEVLFKGLGRIRHVTTGPDGALYVCLPQRIARLSPAP